MHCSYRPAGRYEYRNKGIDVFIEAMNRVRNSGELQREVVAFLMVPAWVRDARADLKEVIEKNIQTTSPMQMPFITHWLNLMDQDKVLNYISHAGFTNQASEKLKIIFVPCYLDGRDGIFNKPYYDLADRYGRNCISVILRTLGIHSTGKCCLWHTDSNDQSGRLRPLGRKKVSPAKTSAKVWLLLNGQTSTISMLLMLSLLQSSHSSRKTKKKLKKYANAVLNWQSRLNGVNSLFSIKKLSATHWKLQLKETVKHSS